MSGVNTNCGTIHAMSGVNTNCGNMFVLANSTFLALTVGIATSALFPGPENEAIATSTDECR